MKPDWKQVRYTFDILTYMDLRTRLSEAVKSRWTITERIMTFRPGSRNDFLLDPERREFWDTSFQNASESWIEEYRADLIEIARADPECHLRIATFFNIAEVAALSQLLSPKVISVLAEAGIRVELSTYPCSPSDPEE